MSQYCRPKVSFEDGLAPFGVGISGFIGISWWLVRTAGNVFWIDKASKRRRLV